MKFYFEMVSTVSKCQFLKYKEVIAQILSCPFFLPSCPFPSLPFPSFPFPSFPFPSLSFFFLSLCYLTSKMAPGALFSGVCAFVQVPPKPYPGWLMWPIEYSNSDGRLLPRCSFKRHCGFCLILLDYYFVGGASMPEDHTAEY